MPDKVTVQEVDLQKGIAYTLKVPFKYGDQHVEKITFRAPTTKDLKTGKVLPFSFDAEGNIDLRIDVMINYMSILSDNPPSMIDKMSPRDTFQVAIQLLPFFVS